MDESEWMKEPKPGGAGSRRKLWSQKAWAPIEQDVLLERRRTATGKKEGSKFTSQLCVLGVCENKESSLQKFAEKVVF